MKTVTSAAARLAGALLLSLLGAVVFGVQAHAASISTLGLTGGAPFGIALDSAGNVYTANYAGNSVSKVLSTGGAAGAPWPVSAGLAPWDVAVGAGGDLYVTNNVSNTLTRVTAAGEATTPFGTVGAVPTGLAVDRSGDVLVANANSNSITRMSSAGAAAGAPWPVALSGTANPYAVALDGQGNAFTANWGNDSVTKIGPTGALAGAPWPVAIPGADPWDVVTDSAGNVYTADNGPDRVSKVTSAGSLAGAPWPVSVGAGSNPTALTIDSAGNIYTADTSLAKISKITAAGAVSTLVSGGPLNSPDGITIDSAGNLYVTNFNGGSVSKIQPGPGEIAPAPPAVPAAPTATARDGAATVTITPNPTDARYGAPTSYSVYSVADPSKACLITAPATSCQVTGLTNGTAYTFAARANLNSWQTGASNPSSAVTPTAPSVSVKGLKAKLTKKSILITSKATVSGAGKVVQTAKQGKKSWCKASKSATAAATLSLKCKIGKKGRNALKKKALKLSIKTTFTPSVGAAVSTSRKLTIKRKR